MLRRLFILGSLFSLVLFVATCALWLRSFHYREEAGRRFANGAGLSVISMEGAAIVYYQRDAGVPVKQDPDWRWSSTDLNDAGTQISLGDEKWSLLGMRWGVSTGTGITGKHSRKKGTPNYAFRLDCYSVPYWLLAAATLILPVRRASGMREKKRQAARILCHACGYDLHANLGKCPQCGAMAIGAKMYDRAA